MLDHCSSLIAGVHEEGFTTVQYEAVLSAAKLGGTAADVAVTLHSPVFLPTFSSQPLLESLTTVHRLDPVAILKVTNLPLLVLSFGAPITYVLPSVTVCGVLFQTRANLAVWPSGMVGMVNVAVAASSPSPVGEFITSKQGAAPEGR